MRCLPLSDLWQWSRRQVRNLIKKLGVEIQYPEDTTRKQNQKGYFKIIKTYKKNPKKELRFINSKRTDQRTDSRTDQTEKNQLLTAENGQKADRSADTTIYPIEPNTNNSSKKCPYGHIFALFCECLPGLPKPTKVTKARKTQLKARWFGNYQSSTGLNSDCSEFWKGFFRYIGNSDFLMGRNGKFQATFDWIIKESNFVKILEGNYHK